MRRATATLLLCLLGCGRNQSTKVAATHDSARPAAAVKARIDDSTPVASNTEPCEIHVHNVIVEEGSNLNLKVRWLRGRMTPTKPGTVMSLDDPRSFQIEILDGAIGTNLGRLAQSLNARVLGNSPLKNVTLAAQGKQLKLNGTLHKVAPVPIQMIADVGVSPDGSRVRLHVRKLSVLKVPVKGLLGALDIRAAELVDVKKTTGIVVNGDDIDINTAAILPPPRNVGRLSEVQVSRGGDLVEIYGTAHEDVRQVREWRNYIRVLGGTVRLGKLTMDHADILVVDTSRADWFNFDLARYPVQLVNGQVRLTPQAGLQIFANDINKIPKTAANAQITAQWMKNRNTPPPPDNP